MASFRGLGNQGWGHTRDSVPIDQVVDVGKKVERAEADRLSIEISRFIGSMKDVVVWR